MISFKSNITSVFSLKIKNFEFSQILNFFFFSKTSFNERRKIIACQGPTPSSFQNHWKMIFSENVDTIFMLCNLRENNKSQCDEYWPKAVGACFEWPKGLDNKELRVRLESETLLEQNLTERVLTVERKNGEAFEKKTVTQIQVIN